MEKRRTINYVSLGCKVNTYETIAVVNEFTKHGFALVDFGMNADVTIINTCTVTQTSDQKSRKTIRQAVKYSPSGIICVMGCYSQLNPNEACNIPGVSIVVGSSNRHLIYDLVMEKITGITSELVNKCETYNEIKDYEDLKVDHYDDRTRGFVKIQDGCENFCSYCTIPFSRGKFRSRPKDSVIEEMKKLTDMNMKEIVLTGINTGAYGKDLDGYTLSSLLNDIINEVPNVGRMRISSIEITEVTDKLIETIKNNPKHFCNHLHIPLQGGTDEILKKMNRKYGTKYYKERIEYVRKSLPEINITCDILAGFNGETDELFDSAYKFIDSMAFGETHIFPYSPRVRTKAYLESKQINFKDRVNGTIQKERVNKLLELNHKNALKYRMMFLGKKLEVIIERIENNIAFGHSSNYLEVNFDCLDYHENDIVNVLITKIDYPVCEGRIVKGENINEII